MDLIMNTANIPQVLLFNMAADERTRQIEAFLRQHRIQVRHVQHVEFRQKLGYLLDLPGFTDAGCCFAPAFSDEMAVMSGFDAQQLNTFLDFFRQAGLQRIEWKAMLTPTNVNWDALTLYSHLRAERAGLEAAKRKNH